MPKKRKTAQLPLTEFGSGREDLDFKTFCEPEVNYYVTTYAGLGTRQKEKLRTYPEAMVLCINLVNSGTNALLYVEGPHKYGFCMPWNHFPKYLKLYNKLTGQKLGMPANYKPKGHSYDR